MTKSRKAREKEYNKLLDYVFEGMDVSWMDKITVPDMNKEEADKSVIELKKRETMEAIASELKHSNKHTISKIKEMKLEISRLRAAMGLQDDTTDSSDSEFETTLFNTAPKYRKSKISTLGGNSAPTNDIKGNLDKLRETNKAN